MEPKRKSRTRSKYTILAVMCLAQLTAGLVWSNYSAIMPVLLEEWSLTGANAGLILSAFQAGYVITVLPLGLLSDKFGTRKVFILSAIATSIAGVASGLFAQGLLSAVILRVLAGLGQGGLYVPGMKLLSNWFPSQERGKALGIYTCALVASYSLPLYLAGPITVAHGWQWAITLTSVWGLLGAALVFFFVKDKPEAETDSESAEKSPPSDAFEAQPPPNNISLIRRVLTKKHLVWLNLGYMSHMWELYGFYGWVGPFMVAMALLQGSQGDSALVYGNTIAATAILMGALAPGLGGLLSDKIGRTKTVSIILLISASCSLSMGWLAEFPLFGLVVAVVLLCGFFTPMESAVFKAGLTELVEPQSLGLALGVQSLLGFGISVVSPLVFGWVLDLSNPGLAAGSQFQIWGWSFALLGIGALVGIAAMYFLRRSPESLKMVGGKR